MFNFFKKVFAPLRGSYIMRIFNIIYRAVFAPLRGWYKGILHER